MRDYAFVVLGVVLIGLFIIAKRKTQGALDPISKYLGETAADVSMVLNGSHDVEYTSAYFVLLPKYVDKHYFIDKQWRSIMSNTHPDTPALFAKITDNSGRLLAKYRHLIGGEVSAATT